MRKFIFLYIFMSILFSAAAQTSSRIDSTNYRSISTDLSAYLHKQQNYNLQLRIPIVGKLFVDGKFRQYMDTWNGNQSNPFLRADQFNAEYGVLLNYILYSKNKLDLYAGMGPLHHQSSYRHSDVICLDKGPLDSNSDFLLIDILVTVLTYNHCQESTSVDYTMNYKNTFLNTVFGMRYQIMDRLGFDLALHTKFGDNDGIVKDIISEYEYTSELSAILREGRNNSELFKRMRFSLSIEYMF